MKINKILKVSILSLYNLIFIWTFFLILVMQSIFNVFTSKQFSMENYEYFIIGGFIIASIYLINLKWGNAIEAFLRNHEQVLLTVILLSLLIWQLYSCYGGYFQSGWDVRTIRTATKALIEHDYGAIDSSYFSWHTNNLFILWVYKIIGIYSIRLGFDNWEFAIVAFHCVLDVLCMLLVYLVTRMATRNIKIAWFSLIISILLVGISPWFIVAYSDATGFIFPTLILFIYLMIKRTQNAKLKGFLYLELGILSTAGFYLKPQIFIMFIAIICAEFLEWVKNLTKPNVLLTTARMALISVGAVSVIVFYNLIIIPGVHIQVNPDTTKGWQHYFFMGLNANTDGVYDSDDVAFTFSFATNEERNKADIDAAFNRIKALGPASLFRHICRKQLVNYGDGTFAWNVEGWGDGTNSFDIYPEWAYNRMSGIIRSFINPDGEHNDFFDSSKQLIWVMIVFFQLYIWISFRGIYKDDENTLMTMLISIIGLNIYVLVFEARARYLFCYAPIYVILATYGVRNFYYVLSILFGKDKKRCSNSEVKQNAKRIS